MYLLDTYSRYLMTIVYSMGNTENTWHAKKVTKQNFIFFTSDIMQCKTLAIKLFSDTKMKYLQTDDRLCT